MAQCAKCGTTNVGGATFCASCGSPLGQAPPPESWRASSDLGAPPAGATDPSRPPAQPGGYVPQAPPQPSYPAYNQSQMPAPGYQQHPVGGASQPMHPAIPAIVSFFVPGAGLFFVPNKAGLAIGIIAATIGYVILATILTFFVVGICLFIAMPLVNIAAAIHSWDEAAKASGGQFQPILFK